MRGGSEEELLQDRRDISLILAIHTEGGTILLQPSTLSQKRTQLSPNFLGFFQLPALTSSLPLPQPQNKTRRIT